MEKTEIDDAVIDVWVGQKNGMNEKVKNSSFNWCAFWFGGFYFLYRKMYLIGILDIIITLILSILVIVVNIIFSLPLIPLIASCGIPIINGFIFYPLYRMHIKNTLNKNVNQNFNPIQVAQKKGGINPGAVGIAIGVTFVVYFAIIFTLISIAIVAYNIISGGKYIYDNFNKDEIYDYFDSYIDRLNPSELEEYKFDI